MTPPLTPEERLASLCQTARTVIDPHLDSRAIEAAVLARVARSDVESAYVTRSLDARSILRGVGFAAAAAGFALLGWHLVDRTRQDAPSATRAQFQREPGEDGRNLLVGQTITAVDRDVTIKHANVANWRLRAPGTVRVVENGERITLALDEGQVDASVAPQQKPEVLAIEVGHVRVAVHGTVFSVRRNGDMANIQLEEGAVRVGFTDGRDGATERLLAAPSHLTVDVRRQTTENSASSRDRQTKVTPPHSSKPRGSGEVTATHVADPAPPATLVEHPPSGEVERIWEAAIVKVSRCFAAQAGADPSVRVSFGTQIQLRIAPDGAVSLAGFDPPVPREVFDCSQSDVTQLRTVPTERGAYLTRPQVLTR